MSTPPDVLQQPIQRDYLGRGWAFPPRWSAPEAPGAADAEADASAGFPPSAEAGRSARAAQPLLAAIDADRAHAELVEADADIREAIRIILGTRLGERVMLPEFGCRLSDHVFAPLAVRTCNLVAAEVRSALERWERRITAVEVVARPAEDEVGRLDIDISYAIETHRVRQNYVYPFYLLQPGQQ
jgi:phage baseplate assembly protein W